MLLVLRRFILYLLVVVLVMTALASVVLRLLTPLLSEYRTDVEQWASQLIQQPISIESIDARMDGFTPKLNLTGVRLLDHNREFEIAKFGGLSIHFGVVSSLMSGTITLDHIELHGLDIALVRDEAGAISVAGLGGINPQSQEGGSEQGGRRFGAWLLQQGKVSLSKSHIRWLDKRQQRQIDFPEISISLRNSGQQHNVHSIFELPEEIGGALEVALNLNGDILDANSWSGTIYLKGDGLMSHALLKQVALQQWRLHRGVVDGEFWGEIAAGQLVQMQGRFLAKEVEFKYQERVAPLSHFDTQALLTRVDSGWQLQLSRINFDGALRGKMPRYLQFRQESEGWRLAMDQLNIGALAPLVAVVKPEALDGAAQLNGVLRNINLNFVQRLESMQAELEEIAISGVKGIPGVSGLSGRAELSDGVLSLAMNSPALELELAALFKKKLPALKVDGTLSARWDSERWQLWSHQLQLNNEVLDLAVATNVQARYKQQPHVAVSADINVTRLDQLRHYVPGNLLSEGLSGWLSKAFHSGQLKDGKLLIFGRGKDISEPSQGGRMEIALEPTAVDLEFHHSWPLINNIDADLRFSGRKMTIAANSGALLSSKVEQVVVKVADFKSPLLEVDGVARFNAADGIRYISQSPLVDIFGKLEESVQAGNDSEQQLKLHLGIPLGNGDAAASKGVTVEGELDFRALALVIDKTVSIDEINGVLAFNQKGVKRSTLHARLFNSPLKLAIYQRRKNSQDSTMITSRSTFDMQQVLADIKMPWAREVTGKSSWDAVVEFNHGQKSAIINLDSKLKGVTSRLPHPVNKVADAELRFDLNYQFAGKSRRQIDLRLGEILSAQLKYPEKGGALRDIHIHLGSDLLTAASHAGLLFTGQLSQLNVGDWLKLLPDGASMQGAGKGGFDLPVQINMKQLHIRDNSEAAGRVEQVKSGLNPSAIPPLNVNINALKYGSLQLGGVVLTTTPSKSGVTVKRLVVSDGNHQLVANGSWKRTSGTEFELKLSAKDTGKMLQTLHFNTPMDQGKLSAQGTLSWPNSPADFSLEKVKGNFHMLISEGVIKDVDTEAGQLLGLFNVRKLLNRIFLDFSDLKKKGLSYKELTGNFRINQGNLYSDDFNMKSLQANMVMSGRTGLVKQDYDQLLSIVPQISDAVPVAGTLIFGPQVAVALLAFRKLFGKEIDKASMQQYRITGSWDKPDIKKIEKNVARSNQEKQ